MPDKPADVAAGKWQERARPTWRTFPGPQATDVALRVALSRAAYAEIAAHAKEALDEEVCGVLVGEPCEDDGGAFVLVEAAIRGVATRKGRGHVTFTQETWNAIHSAMERDHKERQIVGWYHTHPGFGVEFSEMDAFIQRHFFGLPHQVALVMDPLGGDTALGMNGPSGLKYLERFFVDGREHRARMPAERKAAAAGAAGGEALAALEVRVSQLLVTVQELQNSLHRFLLFSGIALAVALVTIVGYSLYRSYTAPLRPPEGISWLPIPVDLEGKPVLVGVKWALPEELFRPQLRSTPTSPTPESSPTPGKETGRQ